METSAGQKTEAEEEEEEEREEPGGPAPADMTGRGANFSYRQDRLFCEEVDLARLVTRLPPCSEEGADTPLYVYSRAQILDNIRSYKAAFAGRDHIVGFSLKANPNPEIVRLVLSEGLSVVAVSGFEVRLALDLGFPGRRIFFNGNGKQRWELRLAAERRCVMNVDSVFNARQLVQVLRGLDGGVPELEVTVRLNVDIDTQVHPYLQTVSKNSKFGVVSSDFHEVLSVLRSERRIKIVGLHCHLGSTIDDVTVFTKLFDRLEDIVGENAGLLSDVKVINVGGGLGIDYHHDKSSTTPTISDLSLALPSSSRFTLMVEPGRSLVGNAGALVTCALGVKRTATRTFAILNASMTELIRPALYNAYHAILPLERRRTEKVEVVDFVGPVCESSDWLGRDRPVVGAISEGDLFAVMDTGAYGMAMASNYNLRARPAEVMVDGDSARIIRARETYEDVVGRHVFTAGGYAVAPSTSAAEPVAIRGGKEVPHALDDEEPSSLSSSSSSDVIMGSDVRIKMQVT